MLHIYCGEGKGKTTAAMGLALRAAGRGKRVVIAQFLKGSNSGERLALAQVRGVELLPVPERVRFSFRMDEEERQEAAERFAGLCEQCRERLAAGAADLVVLDEACAALSTGLLDLKTLLSVLESAPEGAEIVLTGRNPAPELLERADYLTEMRCLRHPFQKGVRAREGIEY